MYDASAKIKKSNVSSDECLCHGPVIFEDLCAMLMRSQSHKVVLVADTEKASLQVSLQGKDTDVAIFLLLKDITNPVTKENIAVPRFTRILIGVMSRSIHTCFYYISPPYSERGSCFKENRKGCLC